MLGCCLFKTIAIPVAVQKHLLHVLKPLKIDLEELVFLRNLNGTSR
jgi:hypothetical protein